RAPITTHAVDERRPGWLARIWERVAEEARQGRQTYVVCPRIGDDDPPSGDAPARADRDAEDSPSPDGTEPAPERPLHSVQTVYAALTEEPALAGVRLGLLHGRLSGDDKDAVMNAFARGDLDVLVATTVIEVGVDVPNASLMVVLDADRFGVSQLHQLRGRIGRGGLPGLCLLVTATDTPSTVDRLLAVAATTDGFELARLDLAQRREGDILGAAQHGTRSQLEFLHVLEHEDVIEDARADAFALVAADPDLVDHLDLRAAVDARIDAEQGAWLERG
ncbi:MAG TPA: helicase-related protein, partial [Phycicoccus sp.]|nr:helicase-related protein [Phycicoccus sp.]